MDLTWLKRGLAWRYFLTPNKRIHLKFQRSSFFLHMKLNALTISLREIRICRSIWSIIIVWYGSENLRMFRDVSYKTYQRWLICSIDPPRRGIFWPSSIWRHHRRAILKQQRKSGGTFLNIVFLMLLGSLSCAGE